MARRRSELPTVDNILVISNNHLEVTRSPQNPSKRILVSLIPFPPFQFSFPLPTIFQANICELDSRPSFPIALQPPYNLPGAIY